MRFDYLVLPGSGSDVARPALNVQMEGLEGIGITCLIDTGAIGNRFGSDWADAAGIHLDGEPDIDLALGGETYRGFKVPVTLGVGPYTWEPEVVFLQGWNHGFQILGQEGFLRFFDVCFRTSEDFLEIEPARR